VLGCNVQHVVNALPWNGHTGQIKRLRIHLPINRQREQKPETLRVYFGGIENRLRWVETSTRDIVVVSRDRDLCLQ